MFLGKPEVLEKCANTTHLKKFQLIDFVNHLQGVRILLSSNCVLHFPEKLEVLYPRSEQMILFLVVYMLMLIVLSLLKLSS